MDLTFAAGLFDSPWVVAAIIIIGAFINWLSQLRQQKQQRDAEKPARETPSESPPNPPGEFDLEETLKRWLGEEVPKPTPALPPVIPRSPSVPPLPGQGRTAPPVMGPPLIPAMWEEVPEVSEVQKQAAARLAQATGLVREHHPAVARVRRGRGGQWSGVWRDRSSVRRAFVSSLVFGPPKGLES